MTLNVLLDLSVDIVNRFLTLHNVLKIFNNLKRLFFKIFKEKKDFRLKSYKREKVTKRRRLKIFKRIYIRLFLRILKTFL